MQPAMSPMKRWKHTCDCYSCHPHPTEMTIPLPIEVHNFKTTAGVLHNTIFMDKCNIQ
jgi:hypothetical protein